MPNPKYQKTIKKPFTLNGIGLHSGEIVAVTIGPAEAGSGIKLNDVPATIDNVSATNRATTIGGSSLTEHLLSAAYGLGVDNLMITVNGPELPALDGSSLPWVKSLEEAGIVEQPKNKQFLTVRQPILLTAGDASLSAYPCDGLIIDFMVNFKGVGEQKFVFDAARQSYKAEISPARTFGYLEEYKTLKERGLALGAGYENALVLDRNGFVNPPRFPDEPVRHKVLDLIGDLALLGKPLKARINAVRSGHKLNAELVRRILEQ